MGVTIHEGNITDVEVDAIINAANTQLQHGGGVAAAIVRAGGRVIQEESDRIGWCDLGKAAATGAGQLRARHVIRVPTIDYTTGRRASLDDIYDGTKAALELGKGLGLRRFAFPLLGAGIAGLQRRRGHRLTRLHVELTFVPGTGDGVPIDVALGKGAAPVRALAAEGVV